MPAPRKYTMLEWPVGHSQLFDHDGHALPNKCWRVTNRLRALTGKYRRRYGYGYAIEILHESEQVRVTRTA